MYCRAMNDDQIKKKIAHGRELDKETIHSLEPLNADKNRIDMRYWFAAAVVGIILWLFAIYYI